MLSLCDICLYLSASRGHLAVYLLVNADFILYILRQIVFADRREVISAGNFHGEYPAKVC